MYRTVSYENLELAATRPQRDKKSYWDSFPRGIDNELPTRGEIRRHEYL